MKLFDRIAVLLLNLCLVILAAVGPALFMAASPAYYHRQFEKTGIYEQDGVRTPIHYIGGESRRVARFSDEQLDAIAAHITDFLFGNTEDFTLVMDGVEINGKKEDGVSVFGKQAVVHMQDVKALMQVGLWGVRLSAVLLPILLLLLFLRRHEAGRLALRYTLVFYALLLIGAAVFLLLTLRDAAGGDLADTLWRNAHHLFFPFQPDKVAGSFFNDALTGILTLELFMDAVYVVVISLVTALSLWGAIARYLRRCEY